MRLTFSRPQRPHTIYIQKSFRDKDGKSTSRKIERLGTEEEIEKKYGCPDGLEWAKAYVERLNEEERQSKSKVRIEIPERLPMDYGRQVLYDGGDLVLLPLFNGLGLRRTCGDITKGTKVKYDLGEILEALVMLRILYPCSKLSSFELNRKRICKTTFALEDMYRALTLLAEHIDDIQASVWKNSRDIMKRDTRIIYYDCTNYYFEIEDNDLPMDAEKVKGRRNGIRRRGKSKEHRPQPLVQMGLLMDNDGIPLSFIIFPGNESEQPTLKKIEEMVARKFGLNEFIVSTDAGLSSEDNRRYNMTEGREYIAVQSLPSLSAADQDMALDPKGWHIAFRQDNLPPIDPENPDEDTFDLTEIDLDQEKHTRFYKEIIVDKCIGGKKSTARPERVIVTYCHDFALYLKGKRAERLKAAAKIVKNKQVRSRQSQQDPRQYISTIYYTADGEPAENIHMAIDENKVCEEARFDGFYAYATSLDDDAVNVLKARTFHSEIEHLFRTTKSFLEARPVYLQREERIRAHFLVCFLAMVIVKMLQKQMEMQDLTIDSFIGKLRSLKFDYFKGQGYRPVYERDAITDRLQEVTGAEINDQFITQKRMNAFYKKLRKVK